MKFKLNILILMFCLLSLITVNAAEVVIDSSASTDKDTYRKNMVVFTTDQIGYVFYNDSSEDVVYKKTTNGGASWGAKQTLVSGANSGGPIIWYDRWTPGGTGTAVHLLWVKHTTNTLKYLKFDTADDSSSGEVDITGVHGGSWNSSNRYYITKSTTGILYAGILHNNVNSAFVAQCSATCTSGGNWSDTGDGGYPFSEYNDDDDIILMPLASGEILALKWSKINDNVFHSKYSPGTTLWSAEATLVSSVQLNVNYKSAWGASVNPDTNDIYFLIHNNPYSNSSTELSYIYSSGTWTQKASFGASNSQVPSLCIGLDANNGDVYGTDIDQNGTADIHMRSWDSTMSSWGPHVFLSSYNSYDYESISINLISDERLYAVWFDNTNNDLVGVTIADLIPSPPSSAYIFSIP